MKISNYVNKKLLFNVRELFPLNITSTVVYVPQVSLFVHVRFGKRNQRCHSKKNYGILGYEEISSPFLLFKHYIDIIGRIVFNSCNKYLLPALFEGEDHSMCFDRYNVFSATSCFSEKKKKRKIKVKVYLFAVKLIRRMVISTCQSVTSYQFIHCFYT